MMFYVAKLTEALGLAVVLIGFAKRFPELIDMRFLGAGLACFAVGWLIEKFAARRQ